MNKFLSKVLILGVMMTMPEGKGMDQSLTAVGKQVQNTTSQSITISTTPTTRFPIKIEDNDFNYMINYKNFKDENEMILSLAFLSVIVKTTSQTQIYNKRIQELADCDYGETPFGQANPDYDTKLINFTRIIVYGDTNG